MQEHITFFSNAWLLGALFFWGGALLLAVAGIVWAIKSQAQ